MWFTFTFSEVAQRWALKIVPCKPQEKRKNLIHNAVPILQKKFFFFHDARYRVSGNFLKFLMHNYTGHFVTRLIRGWMRKNKLTDNKRYSATHWLPSINGGSPLVSLQKYPQVRRRTTTSPISRHITVSRFYYGAFYNEQQLASKWLRPWPIWNLRKKTLQGEPG